MKGLTPADLPPNINPSWKIGIVASTYHKELIDKLVEGARALLVSAGIAPDNIEVFHAPGSFEIPLIGEVLAAKGTYDALMGFGVILQGETRHADLLADAVTKAMMDIQIRHRIPFAFEVLHVHTIDQAIERTEDKNNKGAEAARAVLHTLSELSHIAS